MQKKIIITVFTIALIAGFIWIHPRYLALKENISKSQGVSVETTEHQKRNSSENGPPGPKPFTRYEGDDFGLDKHNELSLLDLTGPFWLGRGISSGDFNNDGWQDIVLATNRGILLYKNLGTSAFTLEDIDIPPLDNLGIHIVAFVDINNDSWQDIYVTSYGGKNYFVLNRKGRFQNPRLLEVPNTGAVLTQAASFGDIDKDGDLDFVQGNWFFGSKKRLPTKDGKEINKLITNDGLQFHEENLHEIPGQTLSVLLSDFTNDGNLDLIVGNDFREPDIFYRGTSEGKFNNILKSENIIPVSSSATMSVDVADFNNDLFPDMYLAALDENEGMDNLHPCHEILNAQEKQMCEKNLLWRDIVKSENMEECTNLQNEQNKNACITMVMTRIAWAGDDKSICEKIPKDYTIQKIVCNNFFVPRIEQQNYEKAIGQLPQGNVLLQGSSEGVFQDIGEEKDVREGLWGWNAKFADPDNDEWQDIYVATGFMGEFLYTQSNVFFHSYGGDYFLAEQEHFGLENSNIINSYTYIDVDNDGDLDIVAVPVNGPLNVYINNETQNNSITFEFQDKKGNHFGIGNKIYIYYGEDSQRHQVRELKLGGGFLSFDAPIAHFGLGKYDRVNKIEIGWSTGEKTLIDKEFLANKKYVITREQ